MYGSDEWEGEEDRYVRICQSYRIRVRGAGIATYTGHRDDDKKFH